MELLTIVQSGLIKATTVSLIRKLRIPSGSLHIFGFSFFAVLKISLSVNNVIIIDDIFAIKIVKYIIHVITTNSPKEIFIFVEIGHLHLYTS